MEVDRPVAYKEVLKTWAKWVDRNIDPNRTTVFFMGMSPNHITYVDRKPRFYFYFPPSACTSYRTFGICAF